jgi:hypothetical protein
MLSIFAEPISQERISREVRVPEREQDTNRAPSFEDAARGNETGADREELRLPAETPEEFEIVLGSRQIASVLFVAIVILALFSAVSYLAGQSISPRKATPVAGTVAVSMPATEFSTPTPTAPTGPMINASIAVSAPPLALKPAIGATKSPALSTSSSHASTKSMAPKSAAPSVLAEVSTDAPMFAAPAAGAMYLQMGAVDKGAAAIFAEGLRKRGFPSFVAAGPNATLFRVLIGPLRDAAAYARTKDALDRIGVNTFGRTYEK